MFVFGQQLNYNITVNNSDAWSANLFFQQGGEPPGWTSPPPAPKIF